MIIHFSPFLRALFCGFLVSSVLAGGVNAQYWAAGSEICPVRAVPASHEWMPGGKHIVYLTGGGLQMLDLETMEQSVIDNTTFFGVPAAAKGNHRIAVLRADADEEHVALATLYIWGRNPSESPVAISTYLSPNTVPVWSPDDTSILAQSTSGALVLVDPLTGEKRLAVAPPDSSDLNGTPVWLDPARIVAQFGSRLYLVDVRSGETSVIPTDRTILALESSGTGQLFGYDFTNEDFRLYDVLTGMDVFISDKHFVFDGFGANGELALSVAEGPIFVINTTGDLLSNVGEIGDWNPKWSPDGVSLAFNRPVEGEMDFLCFTGAVRPAD